MANELTGGARPISAARADQHFLVPDPELAAAEQSLALCCPPRMPSVLRASFHEFANKPDAIC
jgi:hypothetical protein